MKADRVESEKVEAAKQNKERRHNKEQRRQVRNNGDCDKNQTYL
jgi:hypothetical protein